MKFIHTSDWHLGRQFHNVSLLDDQRHVLEQLLAHAEREAVDAVVIAGDVYDRSVPPATAVALLDEFINRCCGELGIPLVVIPGNHDGAERLRFGARQMSGAGLHILGDLEQVERPVVLSGQCGDVAFYGIPYNDPETVRNLFKVELSSYEEAHVFLLERIRQASDTGIPRVVISHCFLEGARESESERPLSIGGADRVSYKPCAEFDYVALGHLHSPQHKGAEHIRYSGSILKYSFSEVGQDKGVTLVEMDGNGFCSAQQLPLVPLRDMRIVEGELQQLVEQGRVDPNSEDYLLARLTDRQALLDAMGQLRAVYPNVLHLEKPGMLAAGEQHADRRLLKRGELEMFRDFFEQVMGQPLSPEQDEAVRRTLAELGRQEASQ